MVTQNEDLDLTTEDVPPTTQVDRPPALEPFDPSRQRESMRGVVAGVLLIVLGFVVAASFLSYWFNWTAKDELEGLLTILFAPIVGLVGAATGFYFGAATTAASERRG